MAHGSFQINYVSEVRSNAELMYTLLFVKRLYCKEVPHELLLIQEKAQDVCCMEPTMESTLTYKLYAFPVLEEYDHVTPARNEGARITK